MPFSPSPSSSRIYLTYMNPVKGRWTAASGKSPRDLSALLWLRRLSDEYAGCCRGGLLAPDAFQRGCFRCALLAASVAAFNESETPQLLTLTNSVERAADTRNVVRYGLHSCSGAHQYETWRILGHRLEHANEGARTCPPFRCDDCS